MDSSTITLNIVEPGSNVPVPNTGLFAKGIGDPETAIISISVILILAIISAIAIYFYRKKKSNKESKNSTGKAVKSTKASNAKLSIVLSSVKHNKKVSIPLTILSLIVSLGTLTSLLMYTGKGSTNAIGSNKGLTVEAEDTEYTIEVGDEPVFAVLPVQVTVEEATQAGYTLTAYTDNTDLVSTTNPNNKIPMITIEGDELTSLQDNTWGLALDNEPEAKDNKVYKALSTDQDNPTLITDKDYEETEANDTTTIYYGFYITPDMPYGTYTGTAINYGAEPNKATTVTFNSKGLYFNNDETQTINTVKYIAGGRGEQVYYSHTPNLNDAGEVIDGNNRMYPTDTDETFIYSFPDMKNTYVEIVKTGSDGYTCGYDNSLNDYFSLWAGNHSNYTAKSNYESGIRINNNTDGKYIFGTYAVDSSMGFYVDSNTVTLSYTTGPYDTMRGCNSGYGYYAKISGYNPNLIVNGEYETPDSDKSHNFLGWSEDENATTPTYISGDDIARNLDLTKDSITLYAIYDNTFSISYNGNGADSGIGMDRVLQYSTNLNSTDKQVDLLTPNFRREGYGFVGWSLDPDAWNKLTDDDSTNDPTIYGPNQTITLDEGLKSKAGEDRKLVMNAIWVPVETTSSGEPVKLQNWTGCNSLTATTYNVQTGTLAVGNNTITALMDARDGNIYAVARLVDGNCWMTENLRLDNGPDLSNANTHNPSLPLTNNYEEQTISNKLSKPSDKWCSSQNTAEEQIACYDHSNLNTNNVANANISPFMSQDFTDNAHDQATGSFNKDIHSYGNYYNWYSATAGNGKQETDGVITVSGDICPAGWQLPVGSVNVTSGSFYYLNQKMNGDTLAQGSNNWRSFPNNFVYSGYWYDSWARERGYHGHYWSSTAADAKYVYSLYFSNSDISPSAGGYTKGDGFSVRCLAPAQ